MSETSSIGLQFKAALLEYSTRYASDDTVCGVKIDLRSQNIDLIVGIRFEEAQLNFTVCTAGNNCEGADDAVFEQLSEPLQRIGVESKGGAAIMIKRNAQVINTAEGCDTIDESSSAETAEIPSKRRGLFGFFGKK